MAQFRLSVPMFIRTSAHSSVALWHDKDDVIELAPGDKCSVYMEALDDEARALMAVEVEAQMQKRGPEMTWWGLYGALPHGQNTPTKDVDAVAPVSWPSAQEQSEMRGGIATPSAATAARTRGGRS